MLESGGVLVIAYGAGLMYKPLGWLVFGTLLALWGWALSPKGQDAMANARERGPEHR
jgi:hypothetical protein